MNVIIMLDPDTFGNHRLFSTETWPKSNRVLREVYASMVVDTVHKELVSRGVNAQWAPRVPMVSISEGRIVETEESTTDENTITIKEFGEIVEEAYQQVLSSPIPLSST